MSAIVIKVDGTDITDGVIISGASFSSLVNGSPGLAKLRVKDVDQTYEFTSGGLLTLDVNSVRVWGGYIMAARKVYALSVIDTDVPPSATRMWEIAGVDHNILFTKRVVFKESDPSNKVDFSYDADTYDDTIIDDIFDNYLDIATDGLTRTGVQRIAKAILDVPGKIHSGKIASAGFTWKQMMDNVQRATGGIYYIDADRDLKYVDVETSTSSYTLTDQPAGGSDVGYQGFTLLENGSNLVNDMFVWGAGNGSNEYVFSRTEDSASIAEHGRWQLPLVTTGLFRQASADIMADSYVYGTPQSHRGGKDNAVSFTCRVFEPLFAAGDVVDVVNGIYGYSDALPIRSMTTTFASPTDPIFDLVLSHAIDQPVGISEFADLIAAGDKPKGDPLDPWKPPPPPPPPPPATCSDVVCGITDDFERTETNTWGTATCGLDWVTTVVAPNTINVNGTAGTIYVTGTINNTSVSMSLGAGDPGLSFPVDDSVKTMHFQIPDFTPLGTTNSYFLVWSPMDHPGLVFGPTIGISADDTLPIVRSFIDYTKFHTGGGAGDIPGTFWNSSSTYTWTVWKTPTGQAQSITNGSSTYSSSTGSDPTYAQLSLTWSAENNSVAPATLRVLDIDVPEITRCTMPQFDDFNRTVSAGGWGTATPSGYAWTPFNNSSQLSVNGAQGVYTRAASGSSTASAYIQATAVEVVPWNHAGGFSMRSTFQPSVIPTGSDGLLLAWNVYNLDVVGQSWVEVRVSSGGAGFLVAQSMNEGIQHDVAYTSWTTELYNVRWDYVPGVSSKFKVWLASIAEPSAWDIEIDDTGIYVLNGAATMFTPVFTSIGASGRTLSVDYIDFDYDGKPCYIDCTTAGEEVVETESFSRTVAPGNTLGTSEFDSAPVWVRTGGGTGAASVNGSAAVFTNGSFPKVGFINKLLSFNRGYPLEILTKFQYHNDYGTDSDVQFGWAMQNSYNVVNVLTASNPGDGRALDLYAAYYDSNFDLINEYSLTLDLSTFPTTDDTWYWIRAQFLADSMQGRIWLDGTSEPSTWDLSGAIAPEIGNALRGHNDFQFQIGASNGGTATGKVDIITLTSNMCAAPGPTAGSSGVPPTGYVCETIDHGITGLFSTAQAFFAGSLQVWVNGLLNIPVYTTPSAGTFELDPALTPSDTLRVCYNANGDPVS